MHSGADLESAIASCMGYKSEVSSSSLFVLLQCFMLTSIELTFWIQGEGFMVGVQINPVKGLPSGFPVKIPKTSFLKTCTPSVLFYLSPFSSNMN